MATSGVSNLANQAGLGSLGAVSSEARAVRARDVGAESAARPASGDALSVSSSGQWAAVRESVRAGLAQIDAAQSAGAQLRDVAAQIRSAASQSPRDNAAIETLIAGLATAVNEAIEGGASLLAGLDLSIQAEPGAAPLIVEGFDARVSNAPQEGGVFAFGIGDAAAEGLSEAASQSLTRLDAALSRLATARRTLSAHESFLNAASGARESVRSDLDADSARLLALQIRQGIEAAGGSAIANAEPQALLSLFRS